MIGPNPAEPKASVALLRHYRSQRAETIEATAATQTKREKTSMAKEETAPTVDPTDIWGRVPPEEKFELLAKAQSRGVGAAMVVALVGCTLAVGFKFDWLMWGALLLAPLIYQFVAGKAWRDLKPPVILEYLAARSATRRFAFASKSQDLFMQLIFRGYAEQMATEEQLEGVLEGAFAGIGKQEVWIALFTDCLVIIREELGGAVCVMAQLLDDRLTIQGESPDSGSDYSNDRQVILSTNPRKGSPMRLKITSRFPAALVVFEHKALSLQEENKKKGFALPDAAVEAPIDDDFPSSASWES